MIVTPVSPYQVMQKVTQLLTLKNLPIFHFVYNCGRKGNICYFYSFRISSGIQE
jgi:hypothetical protein